MGVHALAISAVLAFSGLVLQPQPSKLKVAPADTKAGLTCRITDLTLQSYVQFEGEQPPPSYSVSLSVRIESTGAAAIVPERVVITELLDEQERNLVIPREE